MSVFVRESDLREMSIRVDELLSEALRELVGDSDYGPRLWLVYDRKKHIARLLREARSEARLIEHTSMRFTAEGTGLPIVPACRLIGHAVHDGRCVVCGTEDGIRP